MVDEGTSLFDYEPEELKRRKTLCSSLHHFRWQKCEVNIIDTPGDANFAADVQSSLQVVDTAVVLIDAVAGVQVQTEKVWGYAEANALPRLIFINKMDLERASFNQAIKGVEEILGIKPLVLQMPIGEEESFRGVVDLITMKAYLFGDDRSGSFTEAPIPDDLTHQAEELRGTMIEDIAESSDLLLEKYLDGATLSPEEILTALTRGILSCSLGPVLCGSAINNIGVHQLLNLITSCYPSPLERPFKGG